MKTVVSLFRDCVERAPDKTSVAFGGERWSYADLARAAEGFGAAIGARTGEIVLIFLPQSPQAIAAYFGVMWSGGVPSFMPLPSVKQDPARYWSAHRQLLELIRPQALVTNGAAAGEMRKAGFPPEIDIVVIEDLSAGGSLPAREIAPESVALLQHSSGTTALKRGVALSHGAIVRQVEAYRDALAATPDDIVASWLPVYHDMGLIACTMTPLMLGQTIALLDPFGWTARPPCLFETISAERATLCWLPNFAFEHMARTTPADPARFDLSSMRAFVNCSEPCKAETFERFATRFAPIGVRPEMLQVCYAMAETVFGVTQTPPGSPTKELDVDPDLLERSKVARPSREPNARRLVSCGTPLDSVEIRIVADGREVGPDHVGEIVVRAPFLLTGYYNRPDLTAERLVGSEFYTRDMGFVHDGELYVLGRNEDLIIVHGRNYYAHEIEASLNALPGLKPGRNVAIGLFNAVVGSEDVVVIAERDGDLDERAGTELRRRAKQSIFQQLGLDVRDVHLVAPGWLVKTTSGKIGRSANREKFRQEQAASG